MKVKYGEMENLVTPTISIDQYKPKIGEAKEKVVTNEEAQQKLTPRDYVATITEVLDSNRIRVSLSYNDGVNLYKHKGDDEVGKKFKNFRVNYIKNNIVHLHHSKGIDINIANIHDMLGGFGLISLMGTKGGIQIKSTDTYYAFKKQLQSYVNYLQTGHKPVPWNETYELMQLVSAGIESREKGGIKITLNKDN